LPSSACDAHGGGGGGGVLSAPRHQRSATFPRKESGVMTHDSSLAAVWRARCFFKEQGNRGLAHLFLCTRSEDVREASKEVIDLWKQQV
jgi:hypothetical protein